MKLICKGKIQTGELKYFGQRLIKTDLIETKEKELVLPATFNFNHSWEFSHICSNCKNRSVIREDFDTNSKNFVVIKGLNSTNYDRLLISDICSFFTVLDSIEIDGVFYLNRNDFDYNFDFQRKSSVDLISYSCSNCKTNYLGLIRIGYPLNPEKNLPSGKLGSLSFEEIIEVNKPLFEFFKEKFESPPLYHVN